MSNNRNKIVDELSMLFVSALRVIAFILLVVSSVLLIFGGCGIVNCVSVSIGTVMVMATTAEISKIKKRSE